MKMADKVVMNEVEGQAMHLRLQAAELGTLGQADAIVKLPPALAAYVAIRCYETRLSIGLKANYDSQGNIMQSSDAARMGSANDFALALRTFAFMAKKSEGKPPDKALLKSVWATDAPKGFGWLCPDCGSWATFGGNAEYHAKNLKHGVPTLAPMPKEVRGNE